jgi:hypothetical protein
MRDRWRGQVDEAFAQPLLADYGWVDGIALRKDWKRALANGPIPKRFWYLYVLEHWLRVHSSPNQSAGSMASATLYARH